MRDGTKACRRTISDESFITEFEQFWAVGKVADNASAVRILFKFSAWCLEKKEVPCKVFLMKIEITICSFGSSMFAVTTTGRQHRCKGRLRERHTHQHRCKARQRDTQATSDTGFETSHCGGWD